METYNYMESMIQDIKTYILDHEEELKEDATLSDYDDLTEYLLDALWTEDSVTGNASGSYTFSTWTAEENLCHNMDLLMEALNEFCYEDHSILGSAETCDVIIRCYLLPSAIAEVMEDLAEGNEASE